MSRIKRYANSVRLSNDGLLEERENRAGTIALDLRFDSYQTSVAHSSRFIVEPMAGTMINNFRVGQISPYTRLRAYPIRLDTRVESRSRHIVKIELDRILERSKINLSSYYDSAFDAAHEDVRLIVAAEEGWNAQESDRVMPLDEALARLDEP